MRSIGKVALLALLLATHVMLGQVKPPVIAAHPATATDYGSYQNLGVVYGEVLDWEPRNECRGSDCSSFPMVKLRIAHVFKGQMSGAVVTMDVLFPNRPFRSNEPVTRGEFVMVPFTSDAVTGAWACGRLRPCDVRPKTVLRAVELFRTLEWQE